jgi:hypothetical protein
VNRYPPWKQHLVYGACGVAIVLCCGLYYRQLWTDYATFSQDIEPVCKARYCDFTYFYYPQAQQIRTNDRPVKKYYYSPAFALLLTPLAGLALEDALHAWTWVQAASLALLLAASVLLLRGFPPWTYLLLLILTLTSYPILNNLKWGQANIAFMALIVLAFALAERGLAKSAALALSVVIASRYFPAIYALVFLARGRRAAFAWCIVCVGLLSIALPAWAMGPVHAWNFYTSHLASIRGAYDTMTNMPGSQYLPSTVVRLSGHAFGSRRLWIALGGVLAACNGAAVFWACRRCPKHRTLWAFSFIALSTPLLVHSSWMHYFVYLPLVQAFIAAQLASLNASRWSRAAAILLVWLPSVALATIFFFEYVGDAKLFARSGFVLWSDLSLLALAYLALTWTLWSGTAQRL